MKNKIGQLFIIGLDGPELLSHEAQFIVQNNIGGVILFSRNILNPQQFHKLCSDIYALKDKMPDKTPLFISIDMEGGRVQRLKSPFTEWPPVKLIGDLDSTSLAFKFTFAMGTELKAFGINLNYAPCVDVLTNPKNVVIGDRAVSTDPEMVAKIGSALVRGYLKSGVISCAKHFPGHGNTLVDSHDDLPIEETTLEVLEARELIPFKKVMRSRTEMLMTAHIKFKNIDPDNPVTFSEKILKSLLRDNLRYRGLVMSDDLDMKALRKYYPVTEIPIKALQGGCDILLYCNEPESHKIGFDAVNTAFANKQIKEEQLTASYQKVMALKKEFLSQAAPLKLADAMKVLSSDEHKMIAAAIRDGKIPEGLAT